MFIGFKAWREIIWFTKRTKSNSNLKMTYLRKDIKRASSYLGKICTFQTITDCRKRIREIHANELKTEDGWTQLKGNKTNRIRINLKNRMRPAFFKFISICMKEEQGFFQQKAFLSLNWFVVYSLKLIVSLNKDLDLVIASTQWLLVELDF